MPDVAYHLYIRSVMPELQIDEEGRMFVPAGNWRYVGSGAQMAVVWEHAMKRCRNGEQTKVVKVHAKNNLTMVRR